MRATGIIRRMDDLGRVVIPKEVRRTLKLKEGDPLELYVGDGAVSFRKYVPEAMVEVAEEIRSSLAELGIKIQIYDTDGDAVTSAKQFHREINVDSPQWFELKTEEDDTVAYIYAETELTEVQRGCIQTAILLSKSRL